MNETWNCGYCDAENGPEDYYCVNCDLDSGGGCSCCPCCCECYDVEVDE